MPRPPDLVGNKYGELTVIETIGSKNGRTIWHCKCSCGRVCDVDTHSLTTGNTKSCGCKKYGGRLSHGNTVGGHTRLYNIWNGMKNRCKNKSHIGYKYYGAKGIEVCDEWADFMKFKKWAESNGYDDHLSIDRIDSNKNYRPENCRWVTSKVQSNNTCRNHYITVDGDTKTISQWAEKVGIPSRTIAARINVLGWPPQEAVLTPLRGARNGR